MSVRRPGAWSITLAAVALATAFAACSPSPAPTALAPATAGTPVTIQDFRYEPAQLTVPVGTTVTWTNTDVAAHTVTADDGTFDSATFGQGATYNQVFTKAGTFGYHCTVHLTMTGTVTVK